MVWMIGFLQKPGFSAKVVSAFFLALFFFISPTWARLAPGSAQPGEFLVRFKDDLTSETRAQVARQLASASSELPALQRALLAGQNAEPLAQIGRLGVAKIKISDPEARKTIRERLLQSPLVEYAVPNYRREPYAPLANGPNDPEYQSGRQWWVEAVGADQVVAQNLLPAGSPIIVGIIDSGVMRTHPDLQAKLTDGYNAITPSAAPEDDLGHGTHVAGIAGAATNNGIGGAGTATSGSVRLMPVKVITFEGYGNDYDIAVGMLWAMDHGAKVLNLSFGGPDSDPLLAQIADYAHAHGVVVAAAAGNSAQEGNPVTYPAAYPHVIAVGASNPDGSRAAFSEIGKFVDISAPGVNILSTVIGGGYGVLQGTSMASPVVAGAAAMVLCQRPSLTVEEVENILTSTAVKNGTTGWNSELGWGRVNVYNALRRTGTDPTPAGGPVTYNYPNPFRPGRGEITYVILPLGAGETLATGLWVRIFDSTGRPVRAFQLEAGQVWPGQALRWDGRDESGQTVANGVYPYNVEFNGKRMMNKIVVAN